MPDPPFVLGWDLAGEVAAVGEGVEDFQAGDRVVGMIQWYDQKGSVGAYAESVAVDADWLVPLPDELDYRDRRHHPPQRGHRPRGARAARPAGGLRPAGDRRERRGRELRRAARGAGGPPRDRRRPAATTRTGRAQLGASEVLSRDADLAAIDPVPAVFDAVPLGEPRFAAVEDGGAIVAPAGHLRPIPAGACGRSPS